ncbi:sulfatase-like hydrolase/transferase [Candidatus Binatia bacterium]|nr:sulfatase-like hydrolase/transferase [Candidatus Binatia bacterium]
MAARPNIVFILADDMGWGDFGCFGDGTARTPSLDHLVATGLCLTQHYSASPVCAPARASLLTGRYPQRTGAVDTTEMRGLDRMALSEVTIAELLRAAGYATGLVGKWHNGALDARHHPTARGFAEFTGFCGGWSPYFGWTIERGTSPATQAVKDDGRYLTDVFTDEAVAFVERHRTEPFFLFLSYNAPHYPFQSRPEDLAPYVERGGMTKAVCHIRAMIERMDAGIARVLDTLDRLGLAGDTLVLFSSDNGPQMHGAGEMDTSRFNCGYRGAKLLVYEGGIKLPMVLRWPAGLDGGGRTLDTMIHFTDWLPTLLAVAGGDAPRDRLLDGTNVRPLLQGEHGKTDERRFWQWNRYVPHGECNAAMRDGPWKLVRPAIDELMQVTPEDMAIDVAAKFDRETYSAISRDPLPEQPRVTPPPAQLFDLARDPGETTDLAAREPERVRRMEADLARWFEAVEIDRRAAASALAF